MPESFLSEDPPRQERQPPSSPPHEEVILAWSLSDALQRMEQEAAARRAGEGKKAGDREARKTDG